MLRQNRWKHNNAIPLTMHVHPPVVSPAERWELIRMLLPKSSAEQGIDLSCSVLLFIEPQISLVTSRCKGSDNEWIWMESSVSIQEIMPKTRNKFLRNENSELQSQVNWKATCQDSHKGSWCTAITPSTILLKSRNDIKRFTSSNASSPC